MHTQFRMAAAPEEIRSLVAFDHRIFRKADWFPPSAWKFYEAWWMVVDETRVGCCAFQRDMDFREDLSEDAHDSPLSGSLYISSTGILPRFQGRGFGTLMKAWQVCYARRNGFKRIVTNTRKSNGAMIRLNRRFGFEIVRTTQGYYRDPEEPTVVMRLRL